MIATVAGWISRPDRGRLRIGGRDAAAFLHAQVSNDVVALHDGDGVYTTYLTPQARLLADMAVYRAEDHLLVDVPAAQAADLATRFDQSIFTEDVQIENAGDDLGQITIIGGGADAILARATGLDAGTIRALANRGHVMAERTRIARTDDGPFLSFDLFMPAGTQEALTSRLSEAGAAGMSRELFDALRIEAGRPAFGVDMTTETIPLEAGLLDRAISLTKGCYVGQEVIVRVLHRGGGRVAKRLMRLAFAADAQVVPPAGTPLVDAGVEVGRITSAAFSPHAGRIVALGYVARETADTRKELHAAGSRVEIVGMAG